MVRTKHQQRNHMQRKKLNRGSNAGTSAGMELHPTASAQVGMALMAAILGTARRSGARGR